MKAKAISNCPVPLMGIPTKNAVIAEGIRKNPIMASTTLTIFLKTVGNLCGICQFYHASASKFGTLYQRIISILTEFVIVLLWDAPDCKKTGI